MTSFYVKHRTFTDYVDNAFHFGREEDTMLTRIVGPAGKAMVDYTNEVLTAIEKSGGRTVMLTHGYIYAVYKHDKIPEFKHSRVIK